MRFTVIIHEEDGGFWAEVPDLPGCCSQGDTLEEMIYNIKEAIIAVLKVSIQMDHKKEQIAKFAPGLGSKVEIAFEL